MKIATFSLHDLVILAGGVLNEKYRRIIYKDETGFVRITAKQTTASLVAYFQVTSQMNKMP